MGTLWWSNLFTHSHRKDIWPLCRHIVSLGSELFEPTIWFCECELVRISWFFNKVFQASFVPSDGRKISYAVKGNQAWRGVVAAAASSAQTSAAQRRQFRLLCAPVLRMLPAVIFNSYFTATFSWYPFHSQLTHFFYLFKFQIFTGIMHLQFTRLSILLGQYQRDVLVPPSYSNLSNLS